ncbi:MAG TPA: PhnD/SsuA/transferrin family substrate-binding protein [Kineosporiaceae bacterium]|nr:PhnD/SsuA/transferrin family substrate-binding protein [Kineosporiaceae bacterium]
MRLQLAVSPDIHVRHLSDWYLLATRLSRLTGLSIVARFYDGFDELHRAYEQGCVDVVVANASDATRLVRHAGFLALARPAGVSDEASVVVAADSLWSRVEDLNPGLTVGGRSPGLRVAATDAPDVECICRILLEPADLDPAALHVEVKRNYTLVAKAIVNGEADAGFFLRQAFDELTTSVRRALRPLVSSHIYVVSHALMVGPAAAGYAGEILAALDRLAHDPAHARLLAGVGAPHGWERLSGEDVHFMLDLMSALSGD